MEARILEFTDEGTVYITNGSHNELIELEKEAAEYIRKIQCRAARNTIPPRKGEICLAKNGNKWSRGEVRRNFVSVKHGTVAEVFLLDYGRCINIPLQDLVSASDSPLLCSTQSLAVLYYFSLSHATIVPNSVNAPWSDAVTSVFNNYMDNISCIGWEGQSVQVTINGGTVEIFHQSRNRQRTSFNNLLISSGLLVPTLPNNTQHNDYHVPQVFYESSDSPTPLDESCDSCNNPITTPTNIDKFLPSKPKQHIGVYIQGNNISDSIWSQLEDTPFASSICSSLKGRGFKYPTAVQAYSWPIIWQDRDTVLLSLTGTGKTLAYLLPLLCKMKDNDDESYEPSVLILVGDSYKAWCVNEQVMTILSWLNAALRFKTCAVYFTVEHEATCCILNGVKVLVATPPSLIRLIKTKILKLSNLKHLVLDDVSILYQRFSTDVAQILHLYRGYCSEQQRCNWHLIGCFTKYMPHPWEWFQQCLCNPVTIVTNPLELVILKKLKCHTISSSFLAHVINVFIQNNSNRANGGTIVIAVAYNEEADKLIQMLSMNSINVFDWTRGELPLNCDIAVIADINVSSVVFSSTVSHLVHYSLPTDKTLFTKRHSLIIQTILLATITPCITIFIDDKSINQSKDILELMERLGQQSIPDDLILLAEKKKKIQRKKQKLYSLCNNLKAYGKCIIGIDNCIMAHNINDVSNIHSIIPKPHLPKDGVVKMKVEHVASPVQLWVRILDHTPLHRGDTPITFHGSTLGQLSLDLAIYYSSPEKRILHRNPHKGDYCGLRQPTGECYRVIVLDYSSPLGLYFHHKEKAKVQLIDTGETLVVDVSQLLTLPDKFMDTPSLVIEVYICGLIPLDNDIDWPPESVSIAYELFQGRTLVGCVAASYNGTMWVDPIEERVVLKGLNVRTALMALQQEIVRNGLGCTNNDHLNNIYKLFDINRLDNNWPKYDEYRKITLSSIEGRPVTISAIDSLSSVYVRQISTESLLQSIIERLNPRQFSNISFDKYFSKIRFSVGQMCTALFPYDEIWYRACIMKVNIKTVNDSYSDSDSDSSTSSNGDITLTALTPQLEYLCLFVDYGDIEWVESKGVEPISKELLEIPFQAVECSINGEQHIDDDNIIENIWDYTRDMSLKLKIISCTDKPPSVILTNEDDNNILLLSINNEPIKDQKKEEKQFQSETTNTLILIHQGQIPVLQFLYHIINNKQKIVLTDQDIDIITILMKQHVTINSNTTLQHDTINSNTTLQHDTDYFTLKGILLLLVTHPRYVPVFSLHKTFCTDVINIIKNPPSIDILILSLQILKLIYLETKCNKLVTTDPNTVLHVMSNICIVSNNINSICNAIDIIICLITTYRHLNYSVFDHIIQRLPELLTKDAIVRSCVKLLCVLIDLEIANDIIILHLTRLTRNMGVWPQETREWLLYYSTNSTIADKFTSIWSLCANGQLSVIEQAILQVPNNDVNTNVNNIDSDQQITELTPKVLWSQTRCIVCLSVQVRGCEQHRVKFNEDIISFRCIQDTNVYSFSMELFGKINNNIKSYISMKGGEVVIKMSKLQQMYWPRVTRAKTKLSFVAIDYSRWKEASSSSNSDNETMIPKRSISWDALRKARQTSEDQYHHTDTDQLSSDDVNDDLLDQ